MMKLNKALITLPIVFALTLNAPVYAADKTELLAKPEIEMAIEPMIEPVKGIQLEPRIVDQGLINPDQPVSSQAPDDKNAINDIQAYIDENIGDTFASLHIDRDDNGREKVILSFVADVSPSHKEAIRALADNPELIVFRLVDFTKQQLAEKQKEINLAWDSLEAEGIKIHQTGVNVFINRVEIGIEPYDKESIAKIHEIFGSEMVEVIEGREVHLLGQAEGTEAALALEGAVEDSTSRGFLQTVTSLFKSIFNSLFK